MANLKVWDGTQWVPAGAGPAVANVTPSAPSIPMTGQLWFDTDDPGPTVSSLEGFQIAIWPSNYTVGSTTPGPVGNTITVTSPGTGAVYLASFSVVGSGPAAVVNFITMGLDGAAIDDTNRTHSPANNTYYTSARTYRITGLAVGTHTIGIRSWNSAAGTFTHQGLDSMLMVQRVV